MDPRSAIKRWRAAITAHDYEEASEALEDLRAWVRKGGFIPADLKLMPHEKVALGIRARRQNCKGPCSNPAKKGSKGRRCRGVGPEKKRVIKCVGKRKRAKANPFLKAANPVNPRSHFPKTKRGRPPVNRGWSMQLFGAGEKHLATKRLAVSKEEAFKTAKGMVGRRVKGSRVAKVVLDGPK